MQLCGRSYDNGQPVRLEIGDTRIESLETWRGEQKGALPWIGPGLIDLQVNGYAGDQFTDPGLTVDAVERISIAMDPLGLTAYLVTVTTQGQELLEHLMGTIAEAIETRVEVGRRVAGVHLEGPYICPEDGPRGAHPAIHCRPPNYDEFCRLQEAARGWIKIATMSPEYAGSDAFIRQLTAQGVVVAIGHTNANSQQIQAACDAGARLSTHLGNGAHARIERHPNYIWDQLAEDRLQASLIADGHHLPPAVIKCFVRGKTPKRVILISDITQLGGLDQLETGHHHAAGLGTVELLEDGRAVIAGQSDYLAGATLPLPRGIVNMMRFANLDLAAAIDMASAHPADLLGLHHGRLAVGAPANLIQFHLADDASDIAIQATINAGECVYGEAVC